MAEIVLTEKSFSGIPIVSGVSIGRVLFIPDMKTPISELTLSQEAVEHEIHRYYRALKLSGSDIVALEEKTKDEEGHAEISSILKAHLEIIKDPLITEEVVNTIRKDRKNAEYVLTSIIGRIEKKFLSPQKKAFLADRLQDIQDVSRRIIGHLCYNRKEDNIGEIGQNLIVFSKEFSPSDVAGANSSYIRGFVSIKGSATSHTAIIARAKNIPYLSGFDSACWEEMSQYHESIAILDAYAGEIIFNPKPATLDERYGKKAQNKVFTISSEKKPRKNAVSKLKIAANIDDIKELPALQKQFEGISIGLFRSEFSVLRNPQGLALEEQYQQYSLLAQHSAKSPAVIRLFDFGGDKKFSGFENLEEGCDTRSIRWLLKRPEILRDQLRAILLASKIGNLKILIPWLTDLFELRTVHQELQLLSEELKVSLDRISLGCMIEVPSAVFLIEDILGECDFVSIGTNDLSQNSLVASRESAGEDYLNVLLHPSIIRMISKIVLAAKEANKSVCVCGEAAADPRYIPILIGLGVQEVSVTPAMIPAVMRASQAYALEDCIVFAQQALKASTCAEYPTL